jgi:uncharacterized protein (TIGR00255 family)
MTSDIRTAPALASMTGFARRDGAAKGGAWTCEARSVNGRNLDIRCRVPAGLEAADAAIRAEAARRFRRGSLTVSLTVSRGDATGEVRINRALLDRLVQVARDYAAPGGEVRIETLLGLRGVVESGEAPGEDGDAALAASVAAALPALFDDLAAARAEEGARLAAVLGAHLDTIEDLVRQARATAGAQPAAIRQRLALQLAELLDGPLPEERLAQEVALLAGRADVREELDRLDAHVGQARDLLAEGGAVGRRLDFLMQEFNREANTLCSKSADIALTRIGLALKAAIEQLREQIQNVE